MHPAPVRPVQSAQPLQIVGATAKPLPARDCTPVPLSRRAARNSHTAPSAAVRPRDAQRRDRRRRAATARHDVSLTGLSQKVAIAAAASGMVLTVAIPTTAAVGPADMQQAVQTVPTSPSPVQASADAQVTFDRAALHGKFDPDAKLAEIVAASESDIITAESKGSLDAPLDHVVMTSPFGNRISPITGIGELHTGQDMSEACGTSVKAAAAGTVTFAGWHAYGGGNRVVIEHGNGLETTYNHLSAMNVAVGDVVERGTSIALVGSTGASTGCHLHFEVMIDGENVDPLGWL